MIDFFDKLTLLILLINAATGGWFLFVVGLLLAVSASCGLFAVWQRSREAKRERARTVVRQAGSHVGHQAYDPSQDEATDALVADLDLDDMAGEWKSKRGGERP